jgi:FAD/FMN-containing dehydrogenase
VLCIFKYYFKGETMSVLNVATRDGNKVKIDHDIAEDLQASLRGELIVPGDNNYDQARTIWNAMVDKRPAMIVRCAGVSDVKTAVNFAREHGLLTAVRGGGHNIAGNAVCDDGLVIDLSSMKSVRIDPQSRIAHIEPGVTLGDFDHEAQTFGLVTPLGINSTTGVAGLTLGGGFGWLTRKYGLTIDSLIEADIITADGEFLTVNEKSHPDLFWGIRGGGGNFGVVTRFMFRLYPLDQQVLSGLIVFPIEDAASAMKKYCEYIKDLGEETNAWVILRKAPPLPFLPEEVHGKEIIAFAVFHAGDTQEGAKIIDPIRQFGTLLGEHVGVQPYTAWQTAFDPLLTPGARNYWKSHNFTELNDQTIEAAVKYAKKLPSSQCEIFFGLLGGAASKHTPDETAYPHRYANLVMNVHGRWDEAADDDRCINWARSFFQETSPYATGGVYVNFMTEEETDRIKAAYGESYDRLVELKKKYDPDNLFSMNQNINPGS